MKVTIIGAGYVGLVTAAGLSDLGHNVLCLESNLEKLAHLQKGAVPFYEPGMQDLLAKVTQSGALQVVGFSKQAVADADIVMIAVGTPTGAKDGKVDLQYIHQAVDQIAPHLSSGVVVATKSTVPLGTTRQIAARIKKLNPQLNFAVASNPEFLREGQALYDFRNPDRIVVGCETEWAWEKMRALYAHFIKSGVPFVEVDLETSELVKYAANAFLAAKVAFINEIADLCESSGADIAGVARGIGLDSRIGPKFLNPGPGFGGSCFPKDILALSQMGEEYDSPLSIVEAVMESNAARKQNMARKIITACGDDVKGKKIAVLGLAFKAETDDMRDAPSLDILPMLHHAGAKLHCYDPKAMVVAAQLLPFAAMAKDSASALQDADAAVILTEWAEFKDLDFAHMMRAMRHPLLIDLRNLFRPEDMASKGLHYISVGRPDMAPEPKKRISHG